MVELQHRAGGVSALTGFVASHPDLTVKDFDSLAFGPIKDTVKAALNQDQGGLCVYCERSLEPDAGQVEHIKPKAGNNAHPQLCFVYSNYAHSCINNQTCGQKKKNGLLPIEPGPGCNQFWTLSTDGFIEPLITLMRKQKHPVVQTRDMLGLNKDASLVRDREKWLKQANQIANNSPADLVAFLDQAPFRYLLDTVL